MRPYRVSTICGLLKQQQSCKLLEINQLPKRSAEGWCSIPPANNSGWGWQLSRSQLGYRVNFFTWKDSLQKCYIKRRVVWVQRLVWRITKKVDLSYEFQLWHLLHIDFDTTSNQITVFLGISLPSPDPYSWRARFKKEFRSYK